MEALILDAPVRYWKCPSCRLTDRTQRPDVHTQFHECPALAGASIPLAEVSDPDDKPDAHHVVVQRNDGPEVASILTERGDGSNDCTVFAPAATATSEGF